MRPYLAGTITALIVCLAAVDSDAGRPLTIDDTDPVAYGQFELEAGIAYAHASDARHLEYPVGLAYGLMPRLEISVGYGAQREKRRTGTGGWEHAASQSDTALGAKWLIASETQLRPRIALAATVTLPTASEHEGLGSGERDADLLLIASKVLTERIGAHLNCGYTWLQPSDGDPGNDLLHYGVALDYQLTPAVQAVAEIFAEQVIHAGSENSAACNLGLRWEIIDNLILDCAAGTRLRHTAPGLTLTAGFTWTFDLL